MEDRVNKLLVNFIGLPAVKESIIDICCPVIECREQKDVYKRQGQGIEKDIQKAVDLFTLAATKENSFAAFALGKLYLAGDAALLLSLIHI